MRVSCIDIEPVTNSTTLAHPIDLAGTCTSSGCPQFRVDNVVFGNTTPWTEFGNGSDSAELVHINNAFGVLDHNGLPLGGDEALFAPHLSSYLGTGLNGDNSWAQPDSIGGANNVFAENNTWNTGHLALNDCEAPGPEGCRYVIRYNTISASQTGNFGISQNHGTETGGRSRSGRQAEVYNNTISCVGACTGVDGGLRGGTGMFFGNHAILFAGQGAGNYLGMNDYRTVASFNPWGGCWGNGGYDNNDGVTYYTGTITSGGTTLTLTDNTKSFSLSQTGNPYSFFDTTVGFGSEISSNTATSVTVLGPISEEPWVFSNGDSYIIIRASVCIDQMGRGPGTYISGTTPTPTGWVSEALDPIYEFSDFSTGPANVNDGTIVSGTGKAIQGRDYYSEYLGQVAQTNATTPFNGTTTCAGSNPCGVGWGTLANRPTTCTVAVGYFATDIGAQGTLFECLTTNAWTAKYAPYVYPHPLDIGGGGGNTPTAPNPPSVLFPMIAATATGDHTLCSPCPTVDICVCYATDGEWRSVNGASYLLVAAQGPAGPMGATGPMGPQGPAGASGGVQSVNGKVGKIVISATSTTTSTTSTTLK